MVRLVIFSILLVTCDALPFGYNSEQRETYSPIFNERPVEEFTKSFYFFAAPEDEPRTPDPITASRVTQSVKKNLQVIVIKAPEYNSQANAAVNLAKQAIQTKTLVYLLSKQPDTLDLARRLQETHTVQRPEVRFVKYRTGEDAKRFQEAIKSQYDTLPGSLNTLNAAAAEPVSSQSPKATDASSDDDELFTARHPPFLPTGVDVVPGSSYLPPKRD